MKKYLVLGVVALVVLVVFGTPALIGWLISDQAGSRLEQRLEDADIEWDRGWFRSALRIVDPGFRADVDFRHVSMSPPGWLTLDGRAVLQDPAATVDFSGRVGLGLNSTLHAEAPSLAIAGPVTWRYENPVVDLRAVDDALDTTATADTLLIADDLGNRLALANPGLRLEVAEAGFGKLALMLEVSASRAGLPDSRLALRMAPLDAQALEQLVQGLSQLASSDRESASGGLAAVGVASAWQQLGARGMVVELQALELDGDVSASGQWNPGEQRFTLRGEGARDTLVNWWASITGLAGQLQPETARAEARALLDDLAEDGLITVSGATIRADLDSLPSR